MGLLAIHLPIAAFLSDFCTLLTDLETSGFETGLADAGNSTEQMGKLMDACINGTKLVTVFNLSSQLEFGSAVTFPDMDVTQYFAFSYWDTHASDVYGANFTTSYYDSSVFPPQQADFSSCDSTWTATCTEVHARFAQYQNDTERIDEVIAITATDAQNIFDDMAEIETLFDPVFESAQNITDMLECTFVGVAYDDFKEQLCVNVLPNLATICASFLVTGIFVFFMAIVGCRVRKFWKRADGEYETEQGIEMANEGQIL